MERASRLLSHKKVRSNNPASNKRKKETSSSKNNTHKGHDFVDLTAYPMNYVWSEHQQKFIDPDKKNKPLPKIPYEKPSPTTETINKNNIPLHSSTNFTLEVCVGASILALAFIRSGPLTILVAAGDCALIDACYKNKPKNRTNMFVISSLFSNFMILLGPNPLSGFILSHLSALLLVQKMLSKE